MDSAYKNIIELKEYYIVKSSKTNKPYLDEYFNCYLYETTFEFDDFSKKFTDTYIETKPEHLTPATYMIEFYSYGINNIIVKQANKKEIKIPLENDPDIKKQYYNRETNRNLLRLKQTGEKRYLRELKDKDFFVPLYIEERNPMEYTQIKYSYAYFDKTSKYYLLFSTLQEFNNWNNEQNKKYQPLKMTLNSFEKIRKKNELLINPQTDKILLLNEQIKRTFLKKS